MRNMSNREPPIEIKKRRPIREQGDNKIDDTLSEDEDNDYSSSGDDEAYYNSPNDLKNSTFEQSKQNISQNRSYKQNYGSEKVSVKTNWFTSCYIMIVLLIGSILVLMVSFVAQETTQKNKLTIQKIQEKFPQQPNETLEQIEAVIDDVLKVEPIHPAVFLFLYDRNTKNDDFILAIANFACEKLQVPPNPIILDENVYRHPEVAKQFGYLIEYYKPRLESQKVMVIKNLQTMQSETAQALHTFCDDITPLVNRAVYILTLKVDKYYGSDAHTAEVVLNKMWGDLKKDILAPLITRVINTAIRIH